MLLAEDLGAPEAGRRQVIVRLDGEERLVRMMTNALEYRIADDGGDEKDDRNSEQDLLALLQGLLGHVTAYLAG